MRPEQLERCGQRALEGAELVVDLDAERLEDPLRRMALAEPGRRRHRLLDHLDQVAGALERLLRAAAHDGPRDLARVTLLAVAAEDVRELPLVRLVDDVGGASASADGSMRMSSGASAAYEKPRSGRSSCIDETPRSSRTASARTPFPARPSSTCENSPWSRRALTDGRAAEALEVRRDRRVAVDRDQLPLAAQPPDEQLGVAARAEGAVDDRLARPRVERGEHLVGEDGDVVSLGWQDARQHLPRSLRHCRCSRQRGAIPDLEVVVHAGDRDLAPDRELLEQLGRDHHPALLVELGRGSAGEEVALQRSRLAAERVERAHPTGKELECGPRIDEEASIQAAADHDLRPRAAPGASPGA